MKEIQLTEITESAHKAYAPVEIGEDININAVRDIKDEKYAVEGGIDQKGKNIGRYVFNEDQGRIFMNVEIDGLSRNSSREIVETVSALILQLIPASETDD